tara:strand:- start:21435 stop:22328 length:894 start_codon:yes stop_codon:yes gene_type:complete
MSKNLHLSKKNTFKYLLIGSNGLLGSSLKKIIPKEQLKTLSRNKASININLENFSKLKKIFEKYKFTYVINCAAMTNLKKCENNYIKCKKINSSLPRKLSEFSIKYNFQLIQISTDQFFKNKKFRLNNEKDKIFPINKYAKSKILCEKYVKKNKKNLIIRTNFTGFKNDKKNISFVRWLINSIQKKKTINLFNDIYVSTLDVDTCAKLIIELIITRSSGIYNCATSRAITKKEFGLYLSKKINKSIFYKEVSVVSDPVKRQKYLGLNVNKIEKKLGKKMISPYKAIDNLVKLYLKKK